MARRYERTQRSRNQGKDSATPSQSGTARAVDRCFASSAARAQLRGLANLRRATAAKGGTREECRAAIWDWVHKHPTKYIEACHQHAGPGHHLESKRPENLGPENPGPENAGIVQRRSKDTSLASLAPRVCFLSALLLLGPHMQVQPPAQLALRARAAGAGPARPAGAGARARRGAGSGRAVAAERRQAHVVVREHVALAILREHVAQAGPPVFARVGGVCLLSIDGTRDRERTKNKRDAERPSEGERARTHKTAARCAWSGGGWCGTSAEAAPVPWTGPGASRRGRIRARRRAWPRAGRTASPAQTPAAAATTPRRQPQSAARGPHRSYHEHLHCPSFP